MWPAFNLDRVIHYPPLRFSFCSFERKRRHTQIKLLCGLLLCLGAFLNKTEVVAIRNKIALLTLRGERNVHRAVAIDRAHSCSQINNYILDVLGLIIFGHRLITEFVVVQNSRSKGSIIIKYILATLQSNQGFIKYFQDIFNSLHFSPLMRWPCLERGQNVLPMRCGRGTCARLHSYSSAEYPEPRRPIWTTLLQSRRPSSTQRLNGVPCPIFSPRTTLLVSAWASTWTRPTGPCLTD